MWVMFVTVVELSVVFTLISVYSEPAPTVTTPLGSLTGRYVTTRHGREVQAYLGVPFAEPPVGNLRFEPPQPVKPWSYNRLAVTQPPACPQLVDPRSEEDCLYLNVYTPKPKSCPLLPVLVFFYGGSFEFGAIYGYTHEYLLDEDIVFVVINYRLGLFGFLSTGDEVVPGNMGLKDARCGLRWIQENIEYFGGDPTKVTISGQSNGAILVNFLMIFAAEEGLFRAAIGQSGSALLPYAFRPPVEVRKMFHDLADLSGCPHDSLGFVECLRSKSVEYITNLYTIEYKNSVYLDIEIFVSEILPLVGGVIEPECVEDRLVTGNPWDFNTSIPYLVNINSKELLFAFTVEENDQTGVLLLALNSLFDVYLPLGMNFQNSMADGSVVPGKSRAFYLKDLPISRLTLQQAVDLLDDAIIIYGIFQSVLRSNNNKTYVSFLEYVGKNELFPVPPDVKKGATHGDDLFFFFPHPGTPFPDRQDYLDPSDQVLSEILVKLWTNFVTCLNPTPMETCAVQWKPFFPNHSFLDIKQDSIQNQDHFLEDRMHFWDTVPYPVRDDSYDMIPCKGVIDYCD